MLSLFFVLILVCWSWVRLLPVIRHTNRSWFIQTVKLTTRCIFRGFISHPNEIKFKKRIRRRRFFPFYKTKQTNKNNNEAKKKHSLWIKWEKERKIKQQRNQKMYFHWIWLVLSCLVVILKWFRHHRHTIETRREKR